MAEELVELTAAIQHELELARSGDGYEEAAIAEEIVERLVAPMLAARDQRVSDLQVEFGKHAESWERQRARLDGDRALLRWLHAEAVWHRYQLDAEALKWTVVAGRHAEEIEGLRAESANRLEVGDRLGWRLVEAEEQLKLLKWLHAEASFWLALDRDEHESAEALDAFHRRAVYAEQRYEWAKREIGRLRREVKFEALGADTFTAADAQRAVHPEGGAARYPSAAVQNEALREQLEEDELSLCDGTDECHASLHADGCVVVGQSWPASLSVLPEETPQGGER